MSGRADMLIAAVAKNDPAGVEQAIWENAYTDARDDSERTVLEIAIDNGNSEIAYMLVNYGASLEMTDMRGFTPLMQAAAKNRMEIACNLVGQGADMNVKNERGQTALDIAAAAGHTETVKALRCIAQIQADRKKAASDKKTAARLQTLRAQGKPLRPKPF